MKKLKRFGDCFALFSIGVLIVAAVGINGCVSKTNQEERFRESLTLPAPTVGFTLADPENFSFAFVGDLHIGNGDTTRLTKMLTQAGAEGDSFFIFLGDIVDTGERSDVEAFRKAISDNGWTGKAFPVLGNHDIFSDGWSAYKDSNGAATYTFTVGNSKFIALDTADGALGEGQTDWLRDQLTKDHPTHLFWLSHYLPLVPGQRTYLKLANHVEALKLMKLAVKNQTRAWLGGHYHSFVTDVVEGIQYVVAGGGGGRRMAPVSDFFFVQAKVAGGNVTYQMKKVD